MLSEQQEWLPRTPSHLPRCCRSDRNDWPPFSGTSGSGKKRERARRARGQERTAHRASQGAPCPMCGERVLFQPCPHQLFTGLSRAGTAEGKSHPRSPPACGYSPASSPRGGYTAAPGNPAHIPWAWQKREPWGPRTRGHQPPAPSGSKSMRCGGHGGRQSSLTRGSGWGQSGPQAWAALPLLHRPE